MARLRNLLRTKPEANPASKPARVVIGLRNPGSDYEGTRHNSGYEVLARVLTRAGEKLGRGPSRVQAQLSQIGAGDDRLLYAVPMTYMNESGRAVRTLLDFFGLSPQTSWSSTTTSTSLSGASGFRSGVERRRQRGSVHRIRTRHQGLQPSQARRWAPARADGPGRFRPSPVREGGASRGRAHDRGRRRCRRAVADRPGPRPGTCCPSWTGAPIGSAQVGPTVTPLEIR